MGTNLVTAYYVIAYEEGKWVEKTMHLLWRGGNYMLELTMQFLELSSVQVQIKSC